MQTALPLLNWQKQAEHYRLQTEREELLGRISKLKRHAHKRLALEERVKLTTLRIIELENQLLGRKGGRNV